MATWKDKIPGCFGTATSPFGVHPHDKDRAVRMFELAFLDGATFEDVVSQIGRWLKSRGVNKESIDQELVQVRSFRPNVFKKSMPKLAWIVTWESSSTPWEGNLRTSGTGKEIVSILKHRMSDKNAIEHLKQLYVDQMYKTLPARLAYARHQSDLSPSINCPWIDGNALGEKIICGCGPYLFARRVRNVQLMKDKQGKPVLTWQEMPLQKHLG